MHSVTSSLVGVSNNQSDSLKLPCYCCRWLLFGRAGFSADVTAGQLGHGTDEFGFRMLQDALLMPYSLVRVTSRRVTNGGRAY